MIDVSKFEGKPFMAVNNFLLSQGYRLIGNRIDRKHNLKKMIYLIEKPCHNKVSLWHGWLPADKCGIARPGVVTDVEFMNLDVDENG